MSTTTYESYTYTRREAFTLAAVGAAALTTVGSAATGFAVHEIDASASFAAKTVGPESAKWMSDLLHSVGADQVSQVVDATTHKAVKLFREALDLHAKKAKTGAIVVGGIWVPKSATTLLALAHVAHHLDEAESLLAMWCRTHRSLVLLPSWAWECLAARATSVVTGENDPQRRAVLAHQVVDTLLPVGPARGYTDELGLARSIVYPARFGRVEIARIASARGVEVVLKATELVASGSKYATTSYAIKKA